MPFSLSLSHLTHCKRSRSSNRLDSLRFQPYNFPMQFYSPAYFVLIRMFDDISKYFNKYKTHSTFLVLVTSVHFYLFIYIFLVSLSTSQLKHGIPMLSRSWWWSENEKNWQIILLNWENPNWNGTNAHQIRWHMHVSPLEFNLMRYFGLVDRRISSNLSNEQFITFLRIKRNWLKFTGKSVGNLVS